MIWAINGVNNVRINQNGSAFSVATKNEVKVFHTDPLALLHNLDDVGDCKIAELYNYNLVALVVKSKKYDEMSVILKDMHTGEVLVDIKFKSHVLAIRFSEKKMIVMLSKELHIFEMPTMIRLGIYPTGFNQGLIEISETGHMAFAAPSTGHVHYVNLQDLKEGITVTPVVLQAHLSRIACLVVSHNGKLIATASEKGTLIRVFDITRNQKIELRRGVDSAVVYWRRAVDKTSNSVLDLVRALSVTSPHEGLSIAFSPCDRFLSTCSDKGTVHIFCVDDQSKNRFSVLGTMSSVLPASYQAVGWRSLTQFSVEAECSSILAFSDPNTIISISRDGSYRKFGISRQGECKLKVFANTLDVQEDLKPK